MTTSKNREDSVFSFVFPFIKTGDVRGVRLIGKHTISFRYNNVKISFTDKSKLNSHKVSDSF